MEYCVRVFRINAVNREGLAIVLGTADTATKALHNLRAEFADYPRAWVTDEQDQDVSLADLIQAAEDEQNG